MVFGSSNEGNELELTNYGLITVLFKCLELDAKAFFNVIDAIYLFFKNLFD